MKQYLFLILFISFLFSGCGSSTRLIGSWTNEAEAPKKFEKLAISAITPNTSNRFITELALVEKLGTHNINAIPTFDIFPFAGKVAEIMPVLDDIETVKSDVKKNIVKNNIDGLMIITVLNRETEKRFVNEGFTMGGTGYYGSPYNMGTYYDYYSYSVATIYRSGYYVEDVTYFIECNLYDVASEKLIWSGQTESVDIISVEEEIKKFSNVIVKELILKHIIIP